MRAAAVRAGRRRAHADWPRSTALRGVGSAWSRISSRCMPCQPTPRAVGKRPTPGSVARLPAALARSPMQRS